jgi:pSer/pThr/pTyr-binding forkhead associated (FHA) protein
MSDSAARRAEAYLEIGGQRHPLTPPGLVIGRGSESDLKIDDPGISRRHCELNIHDTGETVQITVTDLGSTNGVVLNGHRVSSAAVPDGSEMRLGNTTVVVRLTERKA